MPNAFRELLFGNGGAAGGLADVLTPRRTFADVILPDATRRALESALVQIEKHDVLYEQWGLGERHQAGLGLAFNFAGPPGTGKTICAEALAHRLDRKLMIVRHADLQSMWVGQTGKNIASIFRAAAKAQAVLLFDVADAIAGQRFDSVSHGYEREANAVVSVLLHELEEHPGVVIFATNLAANFDPAFERRIRTHVRFEMPEASAREQIWRVQLHPHKTPLADDVDFHTLAARYPASGGDIKNAVLKAAESALAAPGPDPAKAIRQHHFVEGMEDVLAAKEVMQQSLFADEPSQPAFGSGLLHHAAEGIEAMAERQDDLQHEVDRLMERLDEVTGRQQRDRRFLLALALAALLMTACTLVVAMV